MDDYLNLLKEMCRQAETAGQEILIDLKGDMANDLHYMCKIFLKRQLSQLRSVILLQDNDDVILIARSMFEGALYLSYSIKNIDMSRRWRLFGLLIDKQRIANGEEAPDELIKFLKKHMPEVDSLFKKENGSYEKYWYGNKSIKQIANEVDPIFVELYEKYYSPMSEYHHWGTAAFGKRYILDLNNIVETGTDEVKSERVNSFCMALSAIVSALKVSHKLLDGNQIEKINLLEDKLKNLPGTITREINITRQAT